MTCHHGNWEPCDLCAKEGVVSATPTRTEFEAAALPPLPKPWDLQHDTNGRPQVLFTADQMQAYARTAIATAMGWPTADRRSNDVLAYAANSGKVDGTGLTSSCSTSFNDERPSTHLPNSCIAEDKLPLLAVVEVGQGRVRAVDETVAGARIAGLTCWLHAGYSCILSNRTRVNIKVQPCSHSTI